jgi:hypothetical protein
MSTCTGDPSYDDRAYDGTQARAHVAAMNQEAFPDGCELCGEPADAEMAEFWNGERGVVAHAQCGIDAGMELA